MAIKEHYNNYQPRDYNQQYDLLTPSTVIPEYLVDHNRLELNPDDTLPAWQLRPDLKRVASLTFRYQPHNTSNANARDTLRYGTVETLFAQHQLWGFETYQEFRDHLAVRDKPLARDTWDQVGYELRTISCRFLFWVPKGTEHHTEPGCWAITIDQTQKRSALVFSDGDIRCYSRLKLGKQNRVVIGKED
jgi:hypothetical protein